MSRLVEYVLIVGIKKPTVDSTQSPEMLRRYPEDDHKDFPLPPDVVFFCQPEGCTTASKRISLRQTNSFVFTLTDKETGITRYGICCNFFRPCLGIPQRRHSKIVKTLTSDSSNSSIDDTNMTKTKFKRTNISKTASIPLSSENYKHSCTHQNSMLCYSLTSICIISSYPFFSTFRECLFVLRKLVESQSWDKENELLWKRENICFDGNQNIGHLPLAECRNWLTLFNSDNLASHTIKSEMLEIVNWIRNLLKIPLPVAGLNRVEVELLPRHVQPPLTFALPEKSRFTFLDYPLHLPLELLGVETCLKILTCIILEQKVVLQSCDYNALSISVMSLTSMLYPLQYMFPIIPLLPTCMKNAEQLLLAPTPYVIGIPSSFFRIKGMNFQVPHDVLIVDLDTNKMSVPLCMDEIPALPEPDGQILKSQLKQCLACLSFSPQPIYDLDKVSDIPRLQTDFVGNRSHMIYGNDIDSIDIAVRAALVKFFCSANVIGNFAQHTRILRLYPRPVVALQKEAFIKSRNDESSFIQALVNTQAVEYFSEWMVNPENTVFRKVQSGILDPRIIGDKPRWYSHYVQPFYFQVHNPHYPLGYDLYEDSDSDADFTESSTAINEEMEKEEAGEDFNYEEVDGNECSCCSSFDDSDEEAFAVIGNSNKISSKDSINTKIHVMYDVSYSAILTEEETDDLQDSILANSVYASPAYSLRSEDHPPSDKPGLAMLNEDLQVDKDQECYSVVESTSTSSSDIKYVPERSAAVRKLTAIIGTIKPKLSSHLSTDSVSSTVSSSSIIPPFENSRLNSNPRNLLDRSTSDTFNHSLMLKNMLQDQKVFNSENQQLITEVVGYVKSGDGVGWLCTKRLRRIMTYEGLRQYLINQIDIEHKSTEVTLNDVHISRNVYRGYLDLLKLVLEGYDHSIKMSGLGGMSSIFPFLEVSHRYYCGKKYLDESTESTSTTSSRKSSFVDTIKESSKCVDFSTDKDSDSSLHYHRELSGMNSPESKPELVNTYNDSDSGAEKIEFLSISHTLLDKTVSNSNGNIAVDNKEKQHLVSKSNCSAGYRFYDGCCCKATLETAGRNVSGTGRRYLFEGLQRSRSPIWDNMDFWDFCFLDSVAAEREAAGMDVNPVELISRYNSLSKKERRLLEEDEDNLLGILLHNMIAFMLSMNVEKKQIKTKVRRLLAKCHIGLTQTQWIDNVLDSLKSLNGNDIDLLVPRSRQLKVQIFVIHLGDSQIGPVFFLEVREDCIVLKSTNGNIVERWWYENVVNLSCSPKTKVLCVWIRAGEETDLQKICTKKCKFLYNSIKASMQRAAERLNTEGTGINLEGDFTVVDSPTGQQGILKVSLEGVTIVFVEKKLSIDVRHLKNCCAKQKVLIVEEYIPHNQSVIEHHFYTDEANEICYAILCLFSYIAAAKHMSSSNSGTNALSNVT